MNRLLREQAAVPPKPLKGVIKQGQVKETRSNEDIEKKNRILQMKKYYEDQTAYKVQIKEVKRIAK